MYYIYESIVDLNKNIEINKVKHVNKDDISVITYKDFLWEEWEETLDEIEDYYVRTGYLGNNKYIGQVIIKNDLDVDEKCELFDYINGQVNSYIMYTTIN